MGHALVVCVRTGVRSGRASGSGCDTLKPYSVTVDGRGQLRVVIAGVVIVVLAIALIVETPGGLESAGIAVVVLAMILVIVQERRRLR
jgi:hypothetical protein